MPSPKSTVLLVPSFTTRTLPSPSGKEEPLSARPARRTVKVTCVVPDWPSFALPSAKIARLAVGKAVPAGVAMGMDTSYQPFMMLTRTDWVNGDGPAPWVCAQPPARPASCEGPAGA